MKHLKELYQSQITFAEFARLTHTDWERIAKYLLSRWQAPVEVEDVVQELLLACWTHLPKFDPSKGVSIDKFIIFRACAKAKQWLHYQRRAHKDKDPSRYELLTDDGIISDAGALQPADQEFEIARTKELDKLLNQCVFLRDAVCLYAFFHAESSELAGREVYRNPELRKLCRLKSEEAAVRAVRGTIETFWS